MSTLDKTAKELYVQLLKTPKIPLLVFFYEFSTRSFKFLKRAKISKVVGILDFLHMASVSALLVVSNVKPARDTNKGFYIPMKIDKYFGFWSYRFD